MKNSAMPDVVYSQSLTFEFRKFFYDKILIISLKNKFGKMYGSVSNLLSPFFVLLMILHFQIERR